VSSGLTDAEIRAGGEGPYRDAEMYDRRYRTRDEDTRFYVELARSGRGPVLELGAGSARVAAAIARTGIEVVAVEREAAMIERANAKLAREPLPIEIVRSSIERLQLRRRFRLVIAPFNVFMHFYARPQIEAALASVARHLAPGGRFAFDVRMPSFEELSRSPDRSFRVRSSWPQHRESEVFSYDPVKQVELVTTVFESPSGSSFIVPLSHRQFFPAELEALLHYNGFEILDRYGDFARRPLDERSESQVIVARARPARRGRSRSL
jgi:SAM-dependent methyltransferase